MFHWMCKKDLTLYGGIEFLIAHFLNHRDASKGGGPIAVQTGQHAGAEGHRLPCPRPKEMDSPKEGHGVLLQRKKCFCRSLCAQGWSWGWKNKFTIKTKGPLKKTTHILSVWSGKTAQWSKSGKRPVDLLKKRVNHWRSSPRRR